MQWIKTIRRLHGWVDIYIMSMGHIPRVTWEATHGPPWPYGNVEWGYPRFVPLLRGIYLSTASHPIYIIHLYYFTATVSQFPRVRLQDSYNLVLLWSGIGANTPCICTIKSSLKALIIFRWKICLYCWCQVSMHSQSPNTAHRGDYALSFNKVNPPWSLQLFTVSWQLCFSSWIGLFRDLYAYSDGWRI